MANTKYTYSISADTANASLSEDALVKDIQDTAIVTALHDIVRVGNVLDVWFKDALSAGDQTILTNTVNNHLGISLIVSAPSASDGKPFFTPNLFPEGDFIVHTGVFDNITAGTIWAGGDMKVSDNAADTDTVVDGQFLHPVDMAGGKLMTSGGLITDCIKLQIAAPATAGVSNTGLGDFNKVEVVPSSGLHIYTFAPSTDGDWDINLTETLNANVDFTKAVPVPNTTKTGWFDYDFDSNVVVVNTQQQGAYDLYDFEVVIANHIPKLSLLCDGYRELTLPAVKTKRVMSQWKTRVTVCHGAGTHQLDVAWALTVGRKKTV